MEQVEDHISWPFVKEVISKLNKAGFKSYLVGGCVRDTLIGRKIGDLDLVTDALPEEVEKLFENTVSIGKSFGIIMVASPHGNIEIATLRKESNYKDGRHPDSVEFVTSPAEDSNRRDFTINSLFLDLSNNKILDFHNGKEDIKNKLIKTVGDPESRFREDYLRIYRAIRFSAQLGFSIEKNTYKSIAECSTHDFSLSKERTMDELIKILKSKNPCAGIQELSNFGLLAPILETKKFTYKEMLFVKKSLSLLENKNLDFSYLLALFYLAKNFNKTEVSKDIIKQSKKTLAHIQNVLSLHSMISSNSSEEKILVFLSTRDSKSLMQVMGALFNKPQLSNVESILKDYKEGWPTSFITGRELMELSLPDKTKYKSIISELYGLQLTKIINSKAEAISYLKSHFK